MQLIGRSVFSSSSSSTLRNETTLESLHFGHLEETNVLSIKRAQLSTVPATKLNATIPNLNGHLTLQDREKVVAVQSLGTGITRGQVLRQMQKVQVRPVIETRSADGDPDWAAKITHQIEAGARACPR